MNEFPLDISLSVLEDLGINLYTSIPAVLSELIANAWDADASRVEIIISEQDDKIVINDNGHGMTAEDVRGRFLKVGYKRRRRSSTSLTDSGRKVMGRKGIGKLSCFAIASTVEVYTVKDGDKTAIQMDLENIRTAIEHEKAYVADILSPTPFPISTGTQIVLRGLKRSPGRSEDFLRRRIARRFTALGNDFTVSVNGKNVTFSDTKYLDKAEFAWIYGDPKDEINEQLKLVPHTFKRSNSTENGHKIHGWIATVREPQDLRDETDSLNRIQVVAHGKVMHENVLPELGSARYYVNYLVGQIEADYLDDDPTIDIATSNRQAVIEDAPTFQELLRFLKIELNHIRKEWDLLRSEEIEPELRGDMAIAGWLDGLDGDERRKAQQYLGRFRRTGLEPHDRALMLKQAVLSFEFLRVKRNLDLIESLSDQDIEGIAKVFRSVDEVEAALYYQIVRQRLQIIEDLIGRAEANVLEAVLRDYVSEHLWLLDPGWDRITEVPSVETTVRKVIQKLRAEDKDDGDERVDIQYSKTSGKHVVIELKRYRRRVDSGELITQINKYYDRIRSALDAQGKSSEELEIIVLVGPHPDSARPERIERQLRESNARLLLYDELIANAQSVYKEFLNASRNVARVVRVLDEIEEDASEFSKLSE